MTQRGRRREGKTHSLPWISLSAPAAFFIAAMFSALKLADSSVLTCISSWKRVFCNRSSSCSVTFFRRSAAVAAVQHNIHHISTLIKLRAEEDPGEPEQQP